MNITAKSRYALKIMLDLASLAEEGVQAKLMIARRQGIPLDFMDQILARLRTSGLVTSTRGRNGGFHLARNPDEISLWEVLESSEDHIYPVKCAGGSEPCGFEETCISSEAWNGIYATIQQELSKKTLSDVLASWKAKHPDHAHHPTEPSPTIVCAR